MTREIKFRMYETVAKKMFSHEDLVKHDLWSGLFEVQRDWQKYMQYTGLKDKQGKEIYEGDIFKSNEWDAYESRDERIEEVKIPKFFVDYIKHQLAQFEIIGNIYENPELLK